MSENSDDLSAVEIAKGVYWLGAYNQATGLHCNPYLVVDGGTGVLIDPGSVLDFEQVSRNLASIIPIEDIKYIVLNHQDPDLASSTPLFERSGFAGEIACHWRCSTIVTYYGLRSPFYLVNEHDNRLVLPSGRKLDFISTPYLHFPGAIVTYDREEKILFSSDLFGAFSKDWSLYAQKDIYIERMRTFHEHYMPSHDILGPVMELFLKMDIRMIAPQHGSIIVDDIRFYIEALRDLECGSFLNPIRKELAEANGYTGLCDIVLKRFTSVFGSREVEEAYAASGLRLAAGAERIEDFDLPGAELWDRFFEIALAKGGLSWLSVVEVLVDGLVRKYSVPLPSVFKARIASDQARLDELTRDYRELKARNERLEESLRETERRIVTDGATGLYNEVFFERYLFEEIATMPDLQECHALLFAGIDRVGELARRQGEAQAEETVKTAAYILKQILPEGAVGFKLAGPEFAVYLSRAKDRGAALEFAEGLRNSIASSGLFIEPLTVSIGLALIGELAAAGIERGRMHNALRATARARLRLAKRRGMNRVCAEEDAEASAERKLALVAEPDPASLDAVEAALEAAGYQVLSASDGEELLSRAEGERPQLIVAELMLAKMDAFRVRERLLEDSALAAIPFILLSFKKGEEEIARARKLRIERFLKKPFFLSELESFVESDIPEESDR